MIASVATAGDLSPLRSAEGFSPRRGGGGTIICKKIPPPLRSSPSKRDSAVGFHRVNTFDIVASTLPQTGGVPVGGGGADRKGILGQHLYYYFFLKSREQSFSLERLEWSEKHVPKSISGKTSRFFC